MLEEFKIHIDRVVVFQVIHNLSRCFHEAYAESADEDQCTGNHVYGGAPEINQVNDLFEHFAKEDIIKVL